MPATAELSALQPGARFLKYEIARLLGRGGHALVYEGYDAFLDRRVAIKVIANPPHARADLSRRAQMEARLLCRIDHPNVVKVLDAGATDEGIVYIIMELLEGESLRAALRAVHRLTVPEALHVGWQIAEATEAAHAHGVIHRDLKPENVFVQSHNRVKVLDFGIAKFVKETSGAPTTERHVFHGTLVYMSPEHLQTAEATPQSDIYALGTILYELLAGLAPCYVGIDNPEIGIRELAAVQITRVPPRLDSINLDVPPGVAAAVARMLAKTAAHRYSSMREVATSLRELAKAFAVTEAGMAARVRSLWRPGEAPLDRLPIVARREEIVRAHAADCELTLADHAAIGSATTAEPAELLAVHSNPAPSRVPTAAVALTTLRASPLALASTPPARATLRLGSMPALPDAEAAPTPLHAVEAPPVAEPASASAAQDVGAAERTERGVTASALPRFAASRRVRAALLAIVAAGFALLITFLWHPGQNQSAGLGAAPRGEPALLVKADPPRAAKPQAAGVASAPAAPQPAMVRPLESAGSPRPVGADLESRAQQRLAAGARPSRIKSRSEAARAASPLAVSAAPSTQKPAASRPVASSSANGNDRRARSRATETVQPVPSGKRVQALPSAGLDP